jgi:hypothetical protein
VKIDIDSFINGTSQTSVDAAADKPISVSVPTDTEKDVQESVEEKPAKRKKNQPVDYESLFLSRNEIRTRQGLYIDRENYEVLQTLVRSIRSERLSVSGLVDNIVRHHIELYGDEINRIYDENNRKPVRNNR